MKSTKVATGRASLLNPTKLQSAALSQAMIAEKAYVIWLSQGQAPGVTESIGSKPNGSCGTRKRPVHWAAKESGRRQATDSVRFLGRLVNPADAGCS